MLNLHKKTIALIFVLAVVGCASDRQDPPPDFSHPSTTTNNAAKETAVAAGKVVAYVAIAAALYRMFFQGGLGDQAKAEI